MKIKKRTPLNLHQAHHPHSPLPPPPLDNSKKLSVEKAKGIAKSDVLSQALGLRPSSPKFNSNMETKGRDRADISNPDTQGL